MNQEINQILDWQANSGLAGMPMVSPDDQRSSMRRFAAGVTIISARDGGVRAGLTATGICSVTVDPPRVVVFVNKNVLANQIIRDSGALCINVLAGDQEDVAKAFAGMVDGVHGEARFAHGQWEELVTGSPVLGRALVNVDCRVIKVFDESTHHAFLCEVLACRERPDGEALVYVNSGFHRIPQ